MTFYLMEIVKSALSATIFKIFANQMNIQKLDFKNEGQGKKNKKNWIDVTRLEMF